MYRAFISIVFLFSLASCVSMDTTPVSEANRQLQEVFTVELSKDDLFNNSLDWAAKTFVDSREVIELKDRDRGRIIGKGLSNIYVVPPDPFTGAVTIPVRFTFIIDVKDNKVRVTYDQFVGLWGTARNRPESLKLKYHNDQMLVNLSQLTESYIKYLNEGPKSQDNW